MDAFFLKLLNMSITASWLVLAILAVRFLFRKTPKWILCLLWGLVALRLICPFSMESKLSLIPDTDPLSQTAADTSAAGKQARGDILDAGGAVLVERHPKAANGEILDSQGNVILAIKDGVTVSPEESRAQAWISFLSKIWITGFCSMLLYTVGSYCLLKRKVATAIPVKRGIKQCESVDSPFVLGILRPVIYLPFDLAEGDCAYVIAHEQAHIRRRDHWWKPFGFLLLSIYWFHPLLWVAYILLCRDIESACDEKVIRDMDEDGRRAYSTALLNCSIHRRRIAACPLAFGEVGVKQRVQGIMHYKKPAFWVILVCLALLAVFSVCFLTDPSTGLPITMYADYVSRTRADLKFRFEALPEDGYQISEGYRLEALVDGAWQELPTLSDVQASEMVVEVTANDADFDAWSLPIWEAVYGRLPDGTYRITKEITIHSDSEEPETYPVSAEFVIGGSADQYVTYRLEDITPTGANLYTQETVKDGFQLVYEGSEGFWLEVWQDGKWQYLEPTGSIEPIFKKEKRYIHELHHPSSHIELNWSDLYGELPDGTYRIAREVTNTTEDDFRVCTAYVEFTIDANWGIDLLMDKRSENSLTVSFLMDDDVSDGTYFHTGAALQRQELMGNWTDIIPLPKDVRPCGDALSHMSAMELSWDSALHTLTEGQYRVAIRIQRVLPSGKTETGMIYEYFDPAEYAWGASIRISEITRNEYGLRLTVEHDGSKKLPEGSLTMSHTFRLERRSHNQWEDMGEPRQAVPDTQHPVGYGQHYETEFILLSGYYGTLSNGSYRLVKDVTRHYADGTAETHPVYAVFAVDNPIENTGIS